jgi:hypothetical protein
LRSSHCFAIEGQRLEYAKEGSFEEFYNFKHMIENPFRIYCDFESSHILIDDETEYKDDKTYTKKYAKQEANGYCIYIVSEFYRGKKLYLYRGENVMDNFYKDIRNKSYKVQEIINTEIDMIITPEQEKKFNNRI